MKLTVNIGAENPGITNAILDSVVTIKKAKDEIAEFLKTNVTTAIFGRPYIDVHPDDHPTHPQNVPAPEFYSKFDEVGDAVRFIRTSLYKSDFFRLYSSEDDGNILMLDLDLALQLKRMYGVDILVRAPAISDSLVPVTAANVLFDFNSFLV